MTSPAIIANRKIAACYLLILLAAGALYIFTCAPTIVWHDSALFTWRIWNNDIEGDIGIALAHPLYILIGIALKYIPLGTFEYRLNLFSAVCGAIAVANVFLLLRLWLKSFRAGVIAAITLSVSWTFWQHAAIVEVYTFYAAQMLTELIVLLLFLRSRKISYLYLLAFLNGLSLANHDWALFCTACYAVMLIVMLCRKEIKFAKIIAVPFIFAVGAAPYVYLMILDFMRTSNLSATINSALFGTLWRGDVTNTSISGKLILENLLFIFLNFATPNIVFGSVGIWYLIKCRADRYFQVLILVLGFMYLGFAFRYQVVDRYAFFLPFYCYGAIFIGIGANVFMQRVRKSAWLYFIVIFAFLPAGVYCFTPETGRRFYPSLGQRRQLPYKDPYKYFLQPWKTGYRGAEKFAYESLDTVCQDGVFWVDSTVVHLVLYIQQAYNYRQDVQVTSRYYRGNNAPVLDEPTLKNYINESAVYVVSPVKGYCPDFMLENYDFQQIWPIYKVMPENLNYQSQE